MRITETLTLITLTLIACAKITGGALAQDPGIGVTWVVPDDESQALSELGAMREAGILLVRTTAIPHTTLFVAADSLGMTFFQDIDVSFLPASALVDSIEYGLAALKPLLDLSERFRSAGAVGLARLADTSDPDACRYFEALADEADRLAPDVVTYYTTRFFRSDKCSHAVDGVMLDVLDVTIPDLRSVVDATTRSTAQVLGFASIGTWVDLDLENRGTANPRSPESQARYLEEALTATATTLHDRGAFVFVHRWQDPASLDDDFGDLIQRRYGLLNSSGGPRPAFDVVKGFATGSQTVFALDRGQPRNSRSMWMTIVGWVAMALFGLFYASSPQMRHMVPRYFLSHGFYREAVASGRESLPAETIAMLAFVSMGVGMLLATVVYNLSMRPVFEVARGWMEPDVRNFIGAVLDQPWTLAALLGSLYALTVVVWTSAMSLISRSGRTLLPAQTLMLIVWAQWPLLLLLLLAPAAATAGLDQALVAASILVVATVAVLVTSVTRTLLDFFNICRPPLVWLGVGVALHPIVLAVLVGAVMVVTNYSDELGYVIHLLTRT